MAGGSSGSAPKYLSALLSCGTLTTAPDDELLERFASRRNASDESAELAFATLLARHGVIRYKDVVRQGLLEKAVSTLLKELAEEKARTKQD